MFSHSNSQCCPIFCLNKYVMSKKYYKAVEEEEKVLVSGNRREYPGVQIIHYQEEGWDEGRTLIKICHDSDGMSIDQFEIFIATFRKVIEIARRKMEKWQEDCDDTCFNDMPQVEINYDSICPEPLVYMLRDCGGAFGIHTAERFANLMERLLTEGRNMDKITV